MEHDFHRELKLQAANHFEANGWTVFQEFALPDRTIADVFGYRQQHGFIIAEVSPTYSASKGERTFNKYYRWCNKLYIVSADEMKLEYGEGAKLIQWMNKNKNMGLLYMNKKRIVEMRPAISHNLDEYTTRQLWDRIDRSSIVSQARVLTETK
jgi:DNA repair protein MmcB-like